jgi:hypothetical protein
VIGTSVSTGSQSSKPAAPKPTATSGEPLGNRVCDAAVLAFALWTVSAHGMVASGGSLAGLLVCFGLIATALLGIRILRRSALSSGPPTFPERRGDLDSGPSPWLRVAGLLLAAAIVAFFLHEKQIVVLWAGSVLLLAGALAVYVLPRPASLGSPARGSGLEVGLWLLAIACAGVALATHRPDLDDAFYVNLAVSAADFPRRPLLAADTLHGIEGLPLLLPVYRLHAYELANAALSWLTGIPAIYAFHWVSAGVAALFVPLAHARLLRRLAPEHWLGCVFALLVVLVAVGETHRWYGNFGLVRIWQGKAIALFVLMPLVYAYGIEFASRPSLRGWLMLAAAQIASVGCSSSALWLAPSGALIALCCVVRPSREGLRVFAMGAATCLYVVVAGWLVKQSMSAGGYGPSLKKPFDPGDRVLESLALLMGSGRVLAFALFATLSAWACASWDMARRFAIVAPLAVWLVLLDPFSERFVVANVTGSSFWRSLWALPVPLLMALVLAAPLSLSLPHPRVSGPIASLALITAFVLFVPSFGALSEQNHGPGTPLRFGVPGLKVPPAAYRWASVLNDSVPPGAQVLAPHYVSVWVPTFHEHAFPVSVRGSYLREIKRHVGTPRAVLRQVMTDYVGGTSDHEQAAAIFRRGLAELDVKGVVLRNNDGSREAREILREAGFQRTLNAVDHEIWVRSSP